MKKFKKVLFYGVRPFSRKTMETWGALHKAWKRYVIAKNKDEYDKMKHYAHIKELQLRISSFHDIGMSALSIFSFRASRIYRIIVIITITTIVTTTSIIIMNK